MTAQTSKANTPSVDAGGEDSLFHFFSRNESFWWPFRAVAKALLQTQQNSAAYIEANRRLIDEMRSIIRKEQNLVFELSESALLTACKVGMLADPSAQIDKAEVNEVFDRAMTGIRELGEAWIDAQVRSLDAMRAYDAIRRGNSESQSDIEAEAA